MIVIMTGDAVLKENKQTVIFCMRGVCGPRKVVNTVPHDVGDPGMNLCSSFNCISLQKKVKFLNF